eukprot:6190358-Pleurochrysis_carterae.AAC.4
MQTASAGADLLVSIISLLSSSSRWIKDLAIACSGNGARRRHTTSFNDHPAGMRMNGNDRAEGSWLKKNSKGLAVLVDWIGILFSGMICASKRLLSEAAECMVMYFSSAVHHRSRPVTHPAVVFHIIRKGGGYRKSSPGPGTLKKWKSSHSRS